MAVKGFRAGLRLGWTSTTRKCVRCPFTRISSHRYSTELSYGLHIAVARCYRSNGERTGGGHKGALVEAGCGEVRVNVKGFGLRLKARVDVCAPATPVSLLSLVHTVASRCCSWWRRVAVRVNVQGCGWG